jgi:predicted nucleic-acid-binding protein
MTAVDTNVLLRIVTNDDKSQAARAAAFLQKQDRVYLAKTVLLEFEWVLRRAYGFAPPGILAALRRLLTAGNLEVEDEVAVLQALDWYGQGMNFADSLHLASAAGARRFATFDTVLLSKARRLATGNLAAL